MNFGSKWVKGLDGPFTRVTQNITQDMEGVYFSE